MRSQHRWERKARKAPTKPSAVNSSQNLSALSPSPASLTTIASPWMPLFPTSVRRKLRYAEDNITLGAAAGVISNYIFRANDLYDPDVTGTGHQPMGFDQMMVFFDHFIVERATIRVRFVNNNMVNSTVYTRVDGNNGAVSDPVVLLETGGCVTQVVAASGNASGNTTLTQSVDVAKYHGVHTSALTSMDSLQGSIASSPTDGIYFHVGCWDQKGSTSSVLAAVVIEFDAIFTEPRTPSLSRLSLVQHEADKRKLKKALREGTH